MISLSICNFYSTIFRRNWEQEPNCWSILNLHYFCWNDTIKIAICAKIRAKGFKQKYFCYNYPFCGNKILFHFGQLLILHLNIFHFNFQCKHFLVEVYVIILYYSFLCLYCFALDFRYVCARVRHILTH